jgi:O-antigen ligase
MQLLDSDFRLEKTSQFFYYVLLLGFISLWLSPFLVSLTTGLSLIYVIANYNYFLIHNNLKITYIAIAVFLLSLGDILLNGYTTITFSKSLLILGFVFILASSFMLFSHKKNSLINFTLIISSVVSLVNIFAITNYLLKKDFYDALLLQSKSIPIPNMHHIHFGIINACIIALLLGLLIIKSFKDKIQFNLAICLLLISVVSFHILSSRTGLLSFYVGILVSMIWYTIQKKSFKAMFLGILIIILSLSMSYYFSDSFRNKIQNSIEDYNSWGKGDEINFKSMAMRMEASKMCIQIIGEYPLGVGAEAQEQVLQATYVKENTPLDMENRVGPHNQFLDFGVKYGWIGMILLFLFFIYLIPIIRKSSFPMIAIVGIIFTSLFFESLLERQTSIFIFSLFIPLSISLFRLEENG